MEGFLVVLRFLDYIEQGHNPSYRGLYRMPPYMLAPLTDPIDTVEAEPLDDYVFGDYKDEEALIPTLERAKELLHRFKNHHVNSRSFFLEPVKMF